MSWSIKPPQFRAALIGMVVSALISASLTPLAADTLFPRQQPSTASSPRLDEVLRLVQRHYVTPLSADEVAERAASSLLRKLDTHSDYLSPAAMAELRADMAGRYAGIGIVLATTPANEEPALSDVGPGTPAALAGLRAGDRLVRVDGQAASSLRMDELLARLRGKAGSITHVAWRRAEPGSAVIERDITRALIDVPTVKTAWLPSAPAGGQRVLVARITSFNRHTAEELRRALTETAEVQAQKMPEALILDLRANGGGLLEAAVDVVSLFVAPGREVLRVEGRDGDDTHHLTRSMDEEADPSAETLARWQLPLTVLINGDTASASEIVAGALRDLERAELVGEKSYGKGSVQSIFRLADGHGVKLTTARYVLPKGQRVDGQGLEPTVTRISQRPTLRTREAARNEASSTFSRIWALDSDDVDVATAAQLMSRATLSLDRSPLRQATVSTTLVNPRNRSH